ncbi:MAG: DUF6259 domain-containing protein [Kiritimatiellae bacterium]|nr:DUF6259 domain-containing protein [Kiritimatiellia bacterium]
MRLLLLAAGALLTGATSAAEPVLLKGYQGNLSVAVNGLSFKPATSACPSLNATVAPWWALNLTPDTWPSVTDKDLVLTDKGQTARIEMSQDGISMIYEKLTDGVLSFPICLTMTFSSRDGGFEVGGTIRNGARGWLITGFTGPVLNGIEADISAHPVLMPEGFGKKINRTPVANYDQKVWSPLGKGYESAVAYPSARGTMQWLAFAGRDGGLYFGSHDPLHRSKRLSVRYDPASLLLGMAIRHDFFCRSGESAELPPTVIKPYTGTWHAAARIYRKWFDANTELRDVPAWVRDSSGWLLSILKQQNGEIMWPYTSLDKLCDVAEARGLDILGLFGWAHGGHDHLYPDYNPCPDMGGVATLKTALAEVRRRGKRSIIYANGQLQEIDATDFWRTAGKDIAIMGRNGKKYQQTYHKYSNIPVYRFALGCLHAQAWYDRMLALAMQANEMGADGILYDQLAIMAPMACYGEGHGHAVPSLVHERERPIFLRRIADHMRRINPEFIVMTEGLHDCALDAVSMFHACQTGAFQTSAKEMRERLKAVRIADVFPEMFRYTFPEVISTVRVPAPMMDRDMVNYTCVYGLRYEIESRYGPDVTYLLEGRVPDAADYAHVSYKPDVATMKATPPAEAARYMKEAIDFQRKNADIFWNGRYTDSEGFAVEGRSLLAKGFAADGEFGVIIWNLASEPQSAFRVKVPGHVLVSASEPGRDQAEPFAALAENGLRLLRWKRP